MTSAETARAISSSMVFSSAAGISRSTSIVSSSSLVISSSAPANPTTLPVSRLWSLAATGSNPSAA
jgi:hypothetical protein